MFSTSSPTYPASVSVVASPIANGTFRIRASVFASSVFPLPVGPISSTFGGPPPLPVRLEVAILSRLPQVGEDHSVQADTTFPTRRQNLPVPDNVFWPQTLMSYRSASPKTLCIYSLFFGFSLLWRCFR